MEDKQLYTYRAKVNSVYDGDTVRLDIDLGCKTILANESVRLHRINAPEVRGAEKEKGKLSRDYLKGRINKKEIYIETIKDKKGKYGRYLVEILLEENGTLININDELVAKGFAIYKDY